MEDDTSTAAASGSRPGSNIPAAYPRSYALSGKIMLSSIIVLFVVVVLMLCLHVYARYLLLRRLRNRRRGSGRQRHILVFASDHGHSAARRGLDPAILSSIPVFTHEHGKAEGGPPLECAVCLCEFEEEEKGRTLPACKHSFHVECIDMWFGSNSTCPLCRSVVRAFDPGEAHVQALPPEPPVRFSGDAAGPTRCEEVRIEVRVEANEEEAKSQPARRVLSFKRILTGDLERGERSGPSTPQPRK